MIQWLDGVTNLVSLVDIARRCPSRIGQMNESIWDHLAVAVT